MCQTRLELTRCKPWASWCWMTALQRVLTEAAVVVLTLPDTKQSFGLATAAGPGSAVRGTSAVGL